MFLREGGPENFKRTVCGATGRAADLAGDEELSGLNDCVGLYADEGGLPFVTLIYSTDWYSPYHCTNGRTPWSVLARFRALTGGGDGLARTQSGRPGLDRQQL